jgi:hypothetical protein
MPSRRPSGLRWDIGLSCNVAGGGALAAQARGFSIRDLNQL